MKRSRKVYVWAALCLAAYGVYVAYDDDDDE